MEPAGVPDARAWRLFAMCSPSFTLPADDGHPGLSEHAVVSAPNAKGLCRSLIAGSFKLKRQVLRDRLQRGITLVPRRNVHDLKARCGEVDRELTASFHVSSIFALKRRISRNRIGQFT